jgi:hypothetical protein
MAQYKHLPIYKSTYDLLEKVTVVTKNFPKDFKYTLGSRLREEVIELVVYIFKANSVRNDKQAFVEKVLERMQVVELLLRLSKDMRLITVKQFSEVVVLSDSVGRQAQGWIKALAS